MTNKQTCLLTIKFCNSIPSDLGTLLLPLTLKFWVAAILWFQVGLNKFYTWGRFCKYSRLSRVIQKISNSYKMASQSLPPAFHSAFCPDGSKICQRFETRTLLWHQTVFSPQIQISLPHMKSWTPRRNSSTPNFRAHEVCHATADSRSLSYCQVSKTWQFKLDSTNFIKSSHQHCNAAFGTFLFLIKKQSLWGPGSLAPVSSSIQGQI